MIVEGIDASQTEHEMADCWISPEGQTVETGGLQHADVIEFHLDADEEEEGDEDDDPFMREHNRLERNLDRAAEQGWIRVKAYADEFAVSMDEDRVTMLALSALRDLVKHHAPLNNYVGITDDDQRSKNEALRAVGGLIVRKRQQSRRVQQ